MPKCVSQNDHEPTTVTGEIGHRHLVSELGWLKAILLNVRGAMLQYDVIRCKASVPGEEWWAQERMKARRLLGQLSTTATGIHKELDGVEDKPLAVETRFRHMALSIQNWCSMLKPGEYTERERQLLNKLHDEVNESIYWMEALPQGLMGREKRPIANVPTPDATEELPTPLTKSEMIVLAVMVEVDVLWMVSAKQVGNKARSMGKIIGVSTATRAMRGLQKRGWLERSNPRGPARLTTKGRVQARKIAER